MGQKHPDDQPERRQQSVLDRDFHVYSHAGLASPCACCQYGAQTSVSSLALMFAFVGFRLTVSSGSVAGSRERSRVATSALNSASRSASRCVTAATFSSARSTSSACLIVRLTPRAAVVARPRVDVFAVFRPMNEESNVAPNEIAVCSF